MSVALPRVIDLQGCLNFRDLGGYPTSDGRTVRWRQVFRSDALHHLAQADVRRLRDVLGLGVVIDLRSTAELASEGRGVLGAEPIAFHHVPLFDADDVGAEARRAAVSLGDRYFMLAEFARERIGRVLRTLADANQPAVYHCAAGKDRTGVVTGVLLAVLGVPDEAIVADYVATQDNLDAIIERLMQTEGYQTMLAALPPDTLHAEPETMRGFLTRMRERHGSMRDYARHAGVDDAALARLADRLLERVQP
jgi:protein-tyrosine phosphatase